MLWMGRAEGVNLVIVKISRVDDVWLPFCTDCQPFVDRSAVELSILRTAFVSSMAACPGRITPSSVEKIKRAPNDRVIELKTTPVGADGGVPPAGGGIVTINAAAFRSIVQGRDPVPLSATHHGLVADCVKPRVDQVQIDLRSDAGQIGNEIVAVLCSNSH